MAGMSFAYPTGSGPLSTLSLYGDGSSTSINLDLSDYIAQSPVEPKSPKSVVSCTVSSGGLFTVSSTSLSGNVLTLNLSSAPAASSYSVQVTLGF